MVELTLALVNFVSARHTVLPEAVSSSEYEAPSLRPAASEL